MKRTGLQHVSKIIVAVHACVRVVASGVPVKIGMMKIQSGDLLHDDLHGLQTIPSSSAKGHS
jgi:hypothetical protein